METFPGKVVILFGDPMVIPVAVEVPMEMVLVPSTMTLPSPEMVVSLNVRAAEAVRKPIKATVAIAVVMPPTMRMLFLSI